MVEFGNMNPIFFAYRIVSFTIYIGKLEINIIKFLLKIFLYIIKFIYYILVVILIQTRYLLNFFNKKISNFLNTWKIKAKTKKNKGKDKKVYIYKKKRQYKFIIQFKYFFAGIILTLISLVLYNSYIFIQELPNPRLIGRINYPVSTQIYDRNKVLLYEIYKNENRIPIPLSKIPKYVIQATIAMEDKQFYKHSGISFIGGIVRAVVDSLNTGTLQGGSTITQQLVKTALLSPERTIIRKAKEIILALWTERTYSKNQILEMYLNQVPYGGSSYGIEQASKMYFGKHVWELSLEESAMLSGLPQAPTAFSPYTNPQNANLRKNEVLKLMFDQHYIDENQYKHGIETELTVLPFSQAIRAPHFVFYVRSELENIYGNRQVEEGGLQVVTTLDYKIQEKAQHILNEELKKVEYLNIHNGAILVTNPKNGEILAMVGSKDYFDDTSGAFNVITALRQPGSSIKPLLYSMALEKKILTSASIIDDSPVTYIFPGTESYRPVNYDGRFHGRVPVRYALANSYNIPAVKTLNMLGVDNFINYAKQIGISTWGDSSKYGLSLSLGGGEVTMLDMAKSFGVFANKGYRVDIKPFISIQNHRGKDVYVSDNIIRKRVISEETAFLINDILSDNFARQFAFGRNSQLEIANNKVAVKTGTTDLKKDNWTIGYTNSFLVVSWVGNNDGEPMNQHLASGVTGAAPIWNRMMTYLLNEYSSPNKDNGQKENTILAKDDSLDDIFTPPSTMVKKRCYYGKEEYFIPGTDKGMCSVNLNPSPSPTP